MTYLYLKGRIKLSTSGHGTPGTELDTDSGRKVAAACMLANQIGHVYDGMITGASPKGTWVRIFKPPVEGRVVSGEKGLDVGDRCQVKLLEVDVLKGFIDFAVERR